MVALADSVGPVQGMADRDESKRNEMGRAKCSTAEHDARDLLDRIEAGDQKARGELFTLLYAELHGFARRQMQGNGAAHSLQPTALVNEAFLRLAGGSWADRKHFMLAASQAMRHVLIDHARAKKAGKRDRTQVEWALDEVVDEYEGQSLDLEALGLALEELAEVDAEMARAVDLYFFAGLPAAEVAQLLGMKRRSYDRRWAMTRAWLYKRIR